MNKSPIIWLIILTFIACFICFFLPFDANATNNIALKSAFSKDKKATALQLIEIDKTLSEENKLILYKTLYLDKNLTAYEKYLLKKMIEKIENYTDYKWDIVFTGTLCSGKTTILELFKQKNYKVVSEVAAEIIEQENKKAENDRIVPWLGDTKRLKFQYNVAKTQLERELQLRNEYLFFLDRGMPDGLAYLKNAGKQEETLQMFDFLNEYITKTIYKLVFYFDPTDNLENTEIRKENDFFRIQIATKIKEVYKELGYTLIVVPLMSIQERFDFVKLFVPNISEFKNMQRRLAKQKMFKSAFVSWDRFISFYNKNYFSLCIQDWDYLKDRLSTDNFLYEYTVAKILNEGTATNTMEHILQTIKYVDALQTATDKEKQDLRIIMFLHDFGKWVSRKGHEKNSAIIARNILEHLNFDKEKINLYCKIIEMHGDLGIYPKTKAKLALLTKKQLRMLYFTTLCDIANRQPFDSKGNRHKLDMIYRHLLNEKIEPENVEIKLNAIDNIAHILDFLYDGHVYLCYYFKNFLIEYNLKSIRKIAYAA
jgi:predicted ATPase